VMTVPASNCVRSITLMPAKAGCCMACVRGIASISRTSGIPINTSVPLQTLFDKDSGGVWQAGRIRLGRCRKITPARFGFDSPIPAARSLGLGVPASVLAPTRSLNVTRLQRARRRRGCC
jgi:hypothetical protein